MTLLQSMPVEGRVVLEDVSWAFYERMLAEIGDGHTRLTFDCGRLEIMSPSGVHERVKKVVSRIIEAYGDALDLTVEGGGSTTFKRKDLRKGLEPDECYWVANAARVMGKTKLNFKTDPPPDLVIEIDVSRPLVSRQPIYAAMGVPEVWTYARSRVTPMHLRRGTYHAADHSLAFPDLPMDVVNQMVQIAMREGQSAATKAFRAWIKSSQREQRER
jgi:Uma2 family endonuclease